ncbi:MAG: type II toxin-antitoxin system RelE/ParE family toxin [Acidobacteriaceae bacterium]|nr:type II toxin-antitoxin system RelE/ParE family toxin [Acidobacteriaceae bacterium]
MQQLYLKDDRRRLPAEAVDKLRKILAFLDDMDSAEELFALPTWKAHRLTGERKGDWGLHVTANWRLTFHIEQDEICDVNYEDYH